MTTLTQQQKLGVAKPSRQQLGVATLTQRLTWREKLVVATLTQQQKLGVAKHTQQQLGVATLTQR